MLHLESYDVNFQHIQFTFTVLLSQNHINRVTADRHGRVHTLLPTIQLTDHNAAIVTFP